MKSVEPDTAFAVKSKDGLWLSRYGNGLRYWSDAWYSRELQTRRDADIDASEYPDAKVVAIHRKP